MERFLELREKYGLFYFDGFEIVRGKDDITLRFDFSLPKLCTFSPAIRIITENLEIFNDPSDNIARSIVFSLGITEALSYLKAVCPRELHVKCGFLTGEQKDFFKKLYFNGLGEFFHVNNITGITQDSFIDIICEGGEGETETAEYYRESAFNSSGKNLIPVGGGKDSAVTLSLLDGFAGDNLFFTVNDQQARTDTVLRAGYPKERIVRTLRTIDKRLLELNKQGFLNGHTPFSAIVAFLSLYCAYITGSENIILSNESSANEPSDPISGVNHQYSKSYEFECDFRRYVFENITGKIDYFSLLRPYSELQIARRFASLPHFFDCFVSCNAGSKENKWCCNCPKCLFVFSILYPFLSEEEMLSIFSENLLSRADLLGDFKALVGLSPVKPFECVGTVSEIRLALSLSLKKLKAANTPVIPFLLAFFDENFVSDEIISSTYSEILSGYNSENNIPEKFIEAAGRMYAERIN